MKLEFKGKFEKPASILKKGQHGSSFSLLVINFAAGILYQLEFSQCVLKEMEVYTAAPEVTNSP